MPEIYFMFYLGEAHTMVSFETLKQKVTLCIYNVFFQRENVME